MVKIKQNEYKAVYSYDGEDTPIDDPLIVHINGTDYYMGRRETGPYLMVWPYQRGEEAVTAGGILIPNASTQNDAREHRYGKVVEVGPMAWSDKRLFPEPRCYLHDWIAYRRYEVHAWGHAVISEKCPDTGVIHMSKTKGEPIVMAKILSDYVLHSFGANLNPQFLDTNVHVGR